MDTEQDFDAASLLAGWLCQPAHARQVAEGLGALLAVVVDALRAEPQQREAAAQLWPLLRDHNWSPLLGAWLERALASGQLHAGLHNELIYLLGDFQAEWPHPALTHEVTRLLLVLDDEATPEVAAVLAEQCLAQVVPLVSALILEAQHPLWQPLWDGLHEAARRLQQDSRYRLDLNLIIEELQPLLASSAQLADVWRAFLEDCATDWARPEPRLNAYLAEALIELALGVLRCPLWQQFINRWLLDTLPQFLTQHCDELDRALALIVEALGAEGCALVRQYLNALLGEFGHEKTAHH